MMASRPSRASRCTAASGRFTGNAVLDSSPAAVSNRLARSMRQSRFRNTERTKPGWLQKSSRPCRMG